MEPAMPRRKKYPGVAYKTNELFDPAPADEIRPQQTSAFDRARVSINDRGLLRFNTPNVDSFSVAKGVFSVT
jgi:hypothetical protein